MTHTSMRTRGPIGVFKKHLAPTQGLGQRQGGHHPDHIHFNTDTPMANRNVEPNACESFADVAGPQYYYEVGTPSVTKACLPFIAWPERRFIREPVRAVLLGTTVTLALLELSASLATGIGNTDARLNHGGTGTNLG